MLPRDKALIAALALLCSLLGLLLWQSRSTIAELESRLNRSSANLLAGTKSSNSVASVKTSDSSAAVATAEKNPDSTGNRASLLAQSPSPFPELNQMMALRRRWSLIARNESLVRLLDIDDPKKARLRNLLVARIESERDAQRVASKNGLSGQAAADAVAQAVSAADREIESCLGPDDFSQYQRAVQTNEIQAGLLGHESELTGSFLEVGQPLTGEQVAQMSALFQEAQAPYRQSFIPGDTSPAAEANYQAVENTILARAPGILSPEQMTALKRYYEMQHVVYDYMEAVKKNGR